jgi:hypothetical protein
MDTLEDNLEQHAPFQAVRLRPTRAKPASTAANVPSHICEACAQAFSTDDLLKHHLFTRHANGGFYLRVNDAIVSDVIFVDAIPEAMQFVPIGSDPVELSIELEGAVPITGMVPAANSLDIRALLSLDDSTCGVVTVRGRRALFEKTYQIHIKRPPELAFDRLDELVIAAQSPLLGGRPARWEILQEAADSATRNSLERRYLRGFGSLLLSENQELFEAEWRSASHRIEEAFGYLHVFASDVARSACNLLAFRMSAFSYILNQPPGRFWQAANFFQTPPVVAAASESPTPVVSGIWMDDYQEGLLAAAADAAYGDWESAGLAIRRLPTALDRGPGNGRKRLVLEARIAAGLGQTDRAQLAYRALGDDPIYGDEARDS